MLHRTKIIATIGPASNDPQRIRKLIRAGMSVARLNFSHGNYEDHAKTIKRLREASEELNIPIPILQDLQGPKVRVSQLPQGEMNLEIGQKIKLICVEDFNGQEDTIPIDYCYLAEDATPGISVLLNDGQLELTVTSIHSKTVTCEVKRGGTLLSRKGVNFPELNLRLPAMTDKDHEDLAFGISQGIDWIALSFVRGVEDIRTLKAFLEEKNASSIPIIAKIEKPQAVEHLNAIMNECDGVMVARGDLGVEMKPEKVPLLQKKIIRACNRQGIPTIVATQMLESMIEHPSPTRAEASDVANAILDRTDAVMLSGESAIGKYPVEAVSTLASIAVEVESHIDFSNWPTKGDSETHAMSEALKTIDRIIDFRWIAAFTTTGYTVSLAAAERTKAPIAAFTTDPAIYYRLNLIWGVTPLLLDGSIDSLYVLIYRIESTLRERKMAKAGDKILILGGMPLQVTKGTNFLKIHTIR